ncbi:hypothetical protein KQX54_017232 [Cotesia glomerata]|uniref:Uncharacterized protein n=1 Tax=Cotesia glomerata TaxID=32391 RepID=A0AAV7HY97_COTGL|nr:hypothetical protein KQX54_017232 [Cotesia glomerata]
MASSADYEMSLRMSKCRLHFYFTSWLSEIRAGSNLIFRIPPTPTVCYYYYILVVGCSLLFILGMKKIEEEFLLKRERKLESCSLSGSRYVSPSKPPYISQSLRCITKYTVSRVLFHLLELAKPDGSKQRVPAAEKPPSILHLWEWLMALKFNPSDDFGDGSPDDLLCIRAHKRRERGQGLCLVWCTASTAESEVTLLFPYPGACSLARDMLLKLQTVSDSPKCVRVHTQL